LPGYVVHGTKGSFIKHKTDVQEQNLLEGKLPAGEDWGKEPDDQKGLLHTVRNGETIREYITSFQGNYMDYFDGTYESIQQATPPPVLAEEGLNVIRIIEAAFKSHKEGRVVEI
jgi:predicted dehydrogenase